MSDNAWSILDDTSIIEPSHTVTRNTFNRLLSNAVGVKEAVLGGLVLDVIIAYLIKNAVRWRRAWGSSKWESLQARVHSSRVGGGFVWDCPTAEVAYSYQFAGERYSAIDSNPFFFSASAEEAAARLRAGEKVTARVNPARPQESVLEAYRPIA